MRERMLNKKAIVSGSVKSRWKWRQLDRQGAPVLNAGQREAVQRVNVALNAMRRWRREFPAIAVPTDDDAAALELARGFLGAAVGCLRGIMQRHVDLTWPDEEEFARGAVEFIRQNGVGHE